MRRGKWLGGERGVWRFGSGRGRGIVGGRGRFVWLCNSYRYETSRGCEPGRGSVAEKSCHSKVHFCSRNHHRVSEALPSQSIVCF
jgi:hypothetical protein